MEDLWKRKTKKPQKIKKARQIPQENDEGNIEYKYKLCSTDNQHRIDKLISQMRYRLYEGEGKAVYNIGFTDNGAPRGIPFMDLYDNLKLFHEMIESIGGLVKGLNVMEGVDGYCANIYIEKSEDTSINEIIDSFYSFKLST